MKLWFANTLHQPSPGFTLANSDTEFGRRVLMLAGSSALAPYQWGGYNTPQEYSFPMVEEQNSNPDTFLCSGT